VRDKAAGAAALVMAELALDQKRKGKTVLDYLDQLEREFGYFWNEGVSVFMRGVEGKQQMAAMLDSLRAEPVRQIAGLAVTAFEDLRDEDGKFGPLKGATDAASRNVLLYRLGEQARGALRPSGTEPKAEDYLEVCSPPCRSGTSEEQWKNTRGEVEALAARVKHDFATQALARIGLEPAAAGIK